MKLIPIFKVRVIYKSGAVQDFWAREFSINAGVCTWKPYSDFCKPVRLGFDEVAAVWQMGVKWRLTLK